jgi:hypothetical protein
MKIFYLLLLLTFLPCKIFAKDGFEQKTSEKLSQKFDKEDFEDDEEDEDNYEIQTGILRQLIEEKPKTEEKITDVFKPSFKNRLVFDVFSNDEYQSTDRKNEFRDTRSRGRLQSSFNFAKNFSLNTFLRLERSSQASENERRSQLSSGGGDRTFENEGISLEELNIAFKDGKHAFILGKFNLNFGSAWRWNRGIWSYDIASNYRQRSKLGVNGIYSLGDAKKNGSYRFSYALFTNDRKNFDNSIITKRDSQTKSDAVAGDTRSLESYITSLDINFDFSEREKLSYHFSYIDLAVNKRATEVPSERLKNQKGLVAGMNYKYPISEKVVLDGLVEYATIRNINGDSAVNNHYFTGNLIAKIDRKWNVTLGYAEESNSTLNKNLTEISAGYEFRDSKIFDRLLLQIGYKNQREFESNNLETRNSLGALIRYQKNF